MRSTPRKPLVFAFLAFSATLASGCVHANRSVVPQQHTVARKSIVDGVPNFAEVTPQLYRGALPDSEGLDQLAKMGVAVVVDLRAGQHDAERERVTKLGMEYVAIPWECSRPNDKDVARFLSFIRDNPDKTVFVHCRYGIDRTGMMIAAYRMSVQEWTAEEAMTEMEDFGFSYLHHYTCPRLVQYEANFPATFRTDPEFQNLQPTVAPSQP